MASPCQFRGRAAIDEGVEVRAIEAQAAYVNPEVFDQLPTELHLDFADGRLIDGVHGVPEALGTKLLSGERKPALQRSLSIPLGHAGLAVGAGQAVQRSQHEILTDAGPLLTFGNVPVDEGDELKLLCQAPGRGEEAERLDARLDGLALLLLEAGEEGIGGAEVGQDDLAGFSVDAPGGDDLEVLVAVDDLGGERRHVLVNTTAGRSMSRGSVRFLLSHYGYGRGYYSKAGARRGPLNLVTTHFDLSRNANRRRSDRKRSAKNTVNASFSEEPEEREGCDASGRTDIHPANPESQARSYPRGRADGHCPNTPSLPCQAAALEIQWVWGGDTHECRSSVCQWATRAIEAAGIRAGSRPRSQSPAQVFIQKCGDPGLHRERPFPGVLRGSGSERDEARDGASHPGAEDCCDHLDCLEERSRVRRQISEVTNSLVSLN